MGIIIECRKFTQVNSSISEIIHSRSGRDLRIVFSILTEVHVVKGVTKGLLGCRTKRVSDKRINLSCSRNFQLSVGCNCNWCYCCSGTTEKGG